MSTDSESKYGLKESVIAKINEVFSSIPEIEQVILYGSRAMGNFRNGSDIDFSVKGDSVTHAHMLWLDNHLDDLLLPYTIDLSLLRQIDNKDLLDHITRVGIVFYERKP